MFQASTCPSSGGQIVLSQYLVSSLSVNGFIVWEQTVEQNLLCSLLSYWIILEQRALRLICYVRIKKKSFLNQFDKDETQFHVQLSYKFTDKDNNYYVGRILI
jgi:hypothetical protein